MGKVSISPEELETELLAMPMDDVHQALDDHLRTSIEELDGAYSEKPANLARKIKAMGRVGVFSFAKSKLEEDLGGVSIAPAWHERARTEIALYIEEDSQNRMHLLASDFFNHDTAASLRLNRLVGIGIESRVRCLPESDKALAIEIAIDPVNTFDPAKNLGNRN